MKLISSVQSFVSSAKCSFCLSIQYWFFEVRYLVIILIWALHFQDMINTTSLSTDTLNDGENCSRRNSEVRFVIDWLPHNRVSESLLINRKLVWKEWALWQLSSRWYVEYRWIYRRLDYKLPKSEILCELLSRSGAESGLSLGFLHRFQPGKGVVSSECYWFSVFSFIDCSYWLRYWLLIFYFNF